MESLEEAPLVCTAVRVHTLSRIPSFTSDSDEHQMEHQLLASQVPFHALNGLWWKVETTGLQSGGLKLETETERTRNALLGNFGTTRCQSRGRQLSGEFLWLQYWSVKDLGLVAGFRSCLY